MKRTAVLFDGNDARRFLAERPPADRVLTLTPDPQAELLRAGVASLSTAGLGGDHLQRRILARMRRAERALKRDLERMDSLGPAARETLLSVFHIHAASTARLWETLRQGPFLVPSDPSWLRTDDREKAFRTLLAHVLSHRTMTSDTVFRRYFKTPPAAWLLRRLNRRVAGLLGRRGCVLTTWHHGGFALLERGLAGRHPGMMGLQLMGFRGDAADWARPLATLWNIARGRTEAWLMAVPEPCPEAEAAARELLARVPDPVIRMGMESLGGLVARNAALTQGLVPAMRELIAAARPACFVSCSLRWLEDAAAGQAARELEVPVILVSHGSHSAPDSATSAYELKEHARGLLTSPLAERSVMQSPHAEKAAAAHDPDASRKPFRPMIWGFRKAPAPRPHPGRVILHAGTFKAWMPNRPWMYETSDEFVAGLSSLVEAVSGMKDTRLIIRIRPHAECGVEALEALLPDAPNCELKTTGSFLEDLAGADALVSHSSTTIEEALHARTPVILWGGTTRYLHLPARTEPPSPGSRAAVYAPRSAGALRPLLERVLDAHAGSPLTDAELAEHVWPEEIPGLDGFLDEIVPGPQTKSA